MRQISEPGCPSDEQLSALATGAAPEADADELLAHLAACDDCRVAFDAVLKPDAAASRRPDRKSIVEDPAFQRAVAEIEQIGSGELLQHSDSERHPRVEEAHRDLVGRHVGRYEVVGNLGEGGMGVVYKARDQRLKRMVALKFVQANRIGRGAVARFRAEAETIAKLSHPNIVQIYEVGDYEGLPYFALELVEGGSLEKHAKGDPLPARKAASIVMALGRAIDYAHRNGVVHRDLKPGNVLVSTRTTARSDSTEVNSGVNASSTSPADSHSATSLEQSLATIPKITDFGLAKNLESDSDLTRSGAIMGTPSYMAPEQARGDNHEVGTSSDIYALGAILYALVTGRPPFVGENYVQTVSMVAENEPIPPTRLQPRLPKDIETICLKCLSKHGSKRYGTAEELSDDLERFLTGKPILARPVGSIERAAKFVRRRPAIATIVGLVAGILLLGLPAMTALYFNSEFHRRAAVESKSDEVKAKSRAQESERNARQQVARLRAAQGVAKMKQGKLFESLVWTASALEEESRLNSKSTESLSHAERVQRFRLAATLRQCPTLTAAWKVPGATSWVGGWNVLADGFYISPDGQSLCISGLESPVRTRRWRAFDGKELPTLDDVGENVTRRRMTRDGRLEAVAYRNFRIKVWDIAKGKVIHEFPIPKALIGSPRPAELMSWRLEFSPDHRFLAAAVKLSQRPVPPPATGFVWNLKTGKRAWQGAIGFGTAIQFDRSSQKALFGGRTLWDAQTGKTTSWKLALEHHGGYPLSPDAGSIAYVYHFHAQRSQGAPKVPDETIQIRDTQTGRLRNLEPRHRMPVFRKYFDPTGRWFLASDTDGVARIWKTSTWRMQSVVHHRVTYWKPAFSPDGRWIAVAGSGNSVEVKDVETNRPVSARLPHSDVIRGVAWAPDGRRLAVLGMNGTVRIWDFARTGQSDRTLDHGSPVNVVRFSPDGRQLATGCLDTTARVWNVASGTSTGTVMKHSHPVIDASWSSDGQLLATTNGPNSFGLNRNAARIWIPSTGEYLTGEFGRHVAGWHGIGRVRFSPGANRLLIQQSSRANLLDLDARQEVVNVLDHPGPGGSLFGELTYSADGQRFITVKGTAGVWTVPSGKSQKFKLEVESEELSWTRDVEASRNDRYFAIASSAGLFVLELPDDLKKMRTVIRHTDQGPMGRVAFDRASRRLLAVDINGMCQIWDLQSAKPIGPRWATGGRVRFSGFGGDGFWIVTVLSTGEIQLWDPETGQSLGPPRQHGAPVYDAALSVGGSLLATAGADGAVRLWDLRVDAGFPQQNLSRPARFLSVRKLAGDNLARLDPGDLKEFDFDRARREFPGMFSVTREAIVSWHLRQAANCRTRQQSAAAKFHAEQARRHAK